MKYSINELLRTPIKCRGDLLQAELVDSSYPRAVAYQRFRRDDRTATEQPLPSFRDSSTVFVRSWKVDKGKHL